jgi:P2 family phage contractile tail tube protein
MAYPRTIRNFNAFVDGVGYFGKVAKATLPELALTTEEFRGGGMDAPVAIDMGMEAMEAELEFLEHSPALLKTLGTRTRFVLRAGALGEDDFEADALVFTLGGRIVKQVQGELGAGEDATLKLTMAVDYDRREHNGLVVSEIDVRNARRIIGGVDQLAAMRAAMAL